MLLGFRAPPVDLDALVAQTQVPARGGSLASGLLAAARRNGRLAVPLDDLGRLLRELASGNPVLVMQNLRFGWWPVWHFAVAIGYDLEAHEIALHSGSRAGYRVPLRTFELTWQRAGRWALVATPAQELPATARLHEVLEALAGLERASRGDAAVEASGAALARWPDEPLLWMARANAWLAQDELEPAEQALREALLRAPRLAPAHNNLAEVLLRRGQLDQARAAAARALVLGGPVPAYLDTREAIERACRAAGSCPP